MVSWSKKQETLKINNNNNETGDSRWPKKQKNESGPAPKYAGEGTGNRRLSDRGKGNWET